MEFPELLSRNDLADFLGISHGNLTYILYIKTVDTMYTTFSIPKKNGSERIIHAPNDALKKIQKILAAKLWEHYAQICEGNHIQPNISHAFQKGKSILTNSWMHRNKRYIVNVDLKNFFDSFHFGRVRGYFIKNISWNLSEDVATTIAQLVCYRGVLPQGAPTSPIITNLICNIMDMRLLKIAAHYKLTYTRYADDMTFSTNDKHFIEHFSAFYHDLTAEITKSGFLINQEKTRVIYHDNRQEVTGLIVNHKLSIPREYYRTTHAMAHSLYKNGEFTIHGTTGSLKQLEGRFAFIDQIEKYNNKHDVAPHSVRNLNRREKKYQEFLFYKNFCRNSMPLIITEGKTDILYLKSALKNLYLEYPQLIEKDGNEWKFHLAFLRRTRKLHYFFDFHPDGADTMQNIYFLYAGGSAAKARYYESLCKKYSIVPSHPVILLYDNELGIKGSPVKKFIGTAKLEENSLKEKLYLPVIGNLYVQIIPAANGQDKCEIEDLFSSEVLDQKIKGRKFDRSGKKNMQEYYNKDIFSIHVASNYQQLDFSAFRPLFDTMQRIMQEYAASKETQPLQQ